MCGDDDGKIGNFRIYTAVYKSILEGVSKLQVKNKKSKGNNLPDTLMMKKFIIPISYFIILNSLVFAQEFDFVFEPDSIPVEVEGWNPYCPFAGGESETTPELCDIDDDGDLDFFNGNFSGKISYYENIGSNLSPVFSLISKNFVEIDLSGDPYAGRTSPEFCDLDNDGDLDLFTGCGRGLVHYWENIGTATEPEFEWVTDSLAYIDGPGFSKLEFIDIDLDDDYDLFIGFWNGSIWYYENTGTPDSFSFEVGIENWEGINVNDCASPCFIDIDADNDLDLFIGNENGYLWYYRNDGDSANYNFTYVTNYYDSIDVGSYASPEFADIDGDGDYDMLIGSVGNTWFYENIGTPEIADFDFVTKYYLTFIPGWKVQVVDINGDDAPDLFGCTGSYFRYTENIGTANEPSFLYVTDSFQGVSRPSIKPCYVDLDNDGDYDLLAGEGVIPGPPTIAYYVNDGTPTEPDLRLYDENYITNPDFYVSACPGVADIDADGDYDLFVSEGDGNFYYYRNDGTPFSPNFTLINSNWQGMSFNMWGGFTFGDIDEDGDLDMFIQNIWQLDDFSNVRFYRNAGTQYVPNMVLVTNVFLPEIEITCAYPYLVDIDDDDDLDLFVGDNKGGISFFRNHMYNNSVNGEPGNQPFTFTLYQNYPNPFNASTVIPFTLDRKLSVKVTVYNQLGQEVWSLVTGHLSLGYHEVVWDAPGVGSGVYLVRLDAGTQSGNVKVVLVK